MKLRRILLPLLALACLLAVAPARTPGDVANVGVPPGTGPVAGPIEVFVQASTETATPGGFAIVDVVLVNSSQELTVRGGLRSEIVFADGSRQGLRLPGPLVLAPDSAILFQVFLPVPSSAPLGEATVSVTAFVGYRPAGGSPTGHVARDADTFEVVAP